VFLKKIDYHHKVKKRIEEYPKIYYYSEIESNIRFGTKTHLRDNRFQTTYIIEKSRQKRIKSPLKIFVEFLNYPQFIYVVHVHKETHY